MLWNSSTSVKFPCKLILKKEKKNTLKFKSQINLQHFIVSLIQLSKTKKSRKRAFQLKDCLVFAYIKINQQTYLLYPAAYSVFVVLVTSLFYSFTIYVWYIYTHETLSVYIEKKDFPVILSSTFRLFFYPVAFITERKRSENIFVPE